jgi:hypothetical protein
LRDLVKEKYHPDNTMVPKIKHVYGLLCCCNERKKMEGTGFVDAINIVERDLNIV